MNLTTAKGQHMRTVYQVTRAYLLDELRTTRARQRVGSASDAVCAKDRRYYQAALAKLRAVRHGRA